MEARQTLAQSPPEELFIMKKEIIQVRHFTKLSYSQKSPNQNPNKNIQPENPILNVRFLETKLKKKNKVNFQSEASQPTKAAVLPSNC